MHEWLKILIKYNGFLCNNLNDTKTEAFRKVTSRIELLAALIISNKLGYVKTAALSKPRGQHREFFLNHWENLFHNALEGYLAAKKHIKDHNLGASHLDVEDQTNGYDEADPTPGTQHYVTQLQEGQQNQITLYQKTQDGFLTPPKDRSNTKKDHSVSFDTLPDQKHRVHKTPPRGNVSKKP